MYYRERWLGNVLVDLYLVYRTGYFGCESTCTNYIRLNCTLA